MIGEVDVFFSPDFYGNLYTPSSSIQDDSISEMIKFIWSKRNEALITLEMVTSSPAFKECVAKFEPWEKLIVESVKHMINDVKNFESQSYQVDETTDRIG